MTSQVAVGEMVRVLGQHLSNCLEVLSQWRASHSYSDHLLPLDVAGRTLAAPVQNAKESVDSAFKEGLISRKDVVKEVCGLAARKFAFGALDEIVSLGSLSTLASFLFGDKLITYTHVKRTERSYLIPH